MLKLVDQQGKARINFPKKDFLDFFIYFFLLPCTEPLRQFNPDYEAVSFVFNQVCGPKACNLALQFTLNELCIKTVWKEGSSLNSK